MHILYYDYNFVYKQELKRAVVGFFESNETEEYNTFRKVRIPPHPLYSIQHVHAFSCLFVIIVM